VDDDAISDMGFHGDLRGRVRVVCITACPSRSARSRGWRSADDDLPEAV
jgi:hypothetical protein